MMQKKYFLYITFFSLIWYSCNNIKGETIITQSEKIIDLGKIQLGNKAEAKFYLKNIGNNDLYIENVIPDCHCTIPSWDKKAILPSDSTVVAVVVTKDFEGIFQQVVKVECNTKEKSHLLVVRGKFVK